MSVSLGELVCLVDLKNNNGNSNLWDYQLLKGIER